MHPFLYLGDMEMTIQITGATQYDNCDVCGLMGCDELVCVDYQLINQPTEQLCICKDCAEKIGSVSKEIKE